MKKIYISPSTKVVLTFTEPICQIIVGSDGHQTNTDFVSDEHIDYGGEKDGEDFAKRFDAWAEWDE